MAEMFEVQKESVDSFVRELPVADRQVGAVFLLSGGTMGVDLFGSPRTFRELFPKILRGYALDAIDLRSNPAWSTSSSTAVGREGMAVAVMFLRRVLGASRTPFAAPGMGETWRLSESHVSGGGLTANGRLMHLSAFQV
jgi:hypothetical protein